jgi:hypothetical protein
MDRKDPAVVLYTTLKGINPKVNIGELNDAGLQAPANVDDVPKFIDFVKFLWYKIFDNLHLTATHEDCEPPDEPQHVPGVMVRILVLMELHNMLNEMKTEHKETISKIITSYWDIDTTADDTTFSQVNIRLQVTKDVDVGDEKEIRIYINKILRFFPSFQLSNHLSQTTLQDYTDIYNKLTNKKSQDIHRKTTTSTTTAPQTATSQTSHQPVDLNTIQKTFDKFVDVVEFIFSNTLIMHIAALDKENFMHLFSKGPDDLVQVERKEMQRRVVVPKIFLCVVVLFMMYVDISSLKTVKNSTLSSELQLYTQRIEADSSTYQDIIQGMKTVQNIKNKLLLDKVFPGNNVMFMKRYANYVKWLRNTGDMNALNIIYNHLDAMVPLFAHVIVPFFGAMVSNTKSVFSTELDARVNSMQSKTILTYLKVRCDESKSNKRYLVELDTDTRDPRKANQTIILKYNNHNMPYYNKVVKGLKVHAVPNLSVEDLSVEDGPLKPNLHNLEWDTDIMFKETVDNMTVSKYQHHYVIGRLTRVFTPSMNNKDVASRTTEITNALLNMQDVFVIGYGASGSGKTSTLIYLNKTKETGIVGHVCTNVAEAAAKSQKSNYKYIHVKRFEAYDTGEQHVSTHDKQKTSLTSTFELKGSKFILFKSYLHTNEHVSRVSATLKKDKDRTKTTLFDVKTELSKVIEHLVDIDRFVKATPNNINSSRSHVILYLQFSGSETATATGSLGPCLMVGDFAGVENVFECGDGKVRSSFLQLHEDGTQDKETPTFFYDKYPIGVGGAPDGDVPGETTNCMDFTSKRTHDHVYKFGEVRIDEDLSFLAEPMKAYFRVSDDTSYYRLLQEPLHKWIASTNKKQLEFLTEKGNSEKVIQTKVLEYLRNSKFSVDTLDQLFSSDMRNEYVNEAVRVHQELCSVFDYYEKAMKLGKQKLDDDALKAIAFEERVKKGEPNVNFDTMWKQQAYDVKIKDFKTKNVIEDKVSLFQIEEHLKSVAQCANIVEALQGRGTPNISYFTELFDLKSIAASSYKEHFGMFQQYLQANREKLQRVTKGNTYSHINPPFKLPNHGQPNFHVIGLKEEPIKADATYAELTKDCKSILLPGFFGFNTEDINTGFQGRPPATKGEPPATKKKSYFTFKESWSKAENVRFVFETLFDTTKRHHAEIVCRANQSEDVCQMRKNEGIFINESLMMTRKYMAYLLYHRNKDRINVAPPHVPSCLTQYCESAISCFQLGSDDCKDGSCAGVLFNNVIATLGPDRVKNMLVAVMGVLNISNTVVEPPPVPYIDTNSFKRAFYALGHGHHDTVIEALQVFKLTETYKRPNEKTSIFESYSIYSQFIKYCIDLETNINSSLRGKLSKNIGVVKNVVSSIQALKESVKHDPHTSFDIVDIKRFNKVCDSQRHTDIYIEMTIVHQYLFSFSISSELMSKISNKCQNDDISDKELKTETIQILNDCMKYIEIYRINGINEQLLKSIKTIITKLEQPVAQAPTSVQAGGVGARLGDQKPASTHTTTTAQGRGVYPGSRGRGVYQGSRNIHNPASTHTTTTAQGRGVYPGSRGRGVYQGSRNIHNPASTHTTTTAQGSRDIQETAARAWGTTEPKPADDNCDSILSLFAAIESTSVYKFQKLYHECRQDVNSVLGKSSHEVKSLFEKIITLFDKNNDASPVGTMAFMDTIAKFQTTRSILCDYLKMSPDVQRQFMQDKSFVDVVGL